MGSTFGRDKRWITKSALLAVTLVQDQYNNMFPAQEQLKQITRLVDAAAPNFPSQFTDRRTKDVYFSEAIAELVEHFGQEGALGFPWDAADAKEQLVQFTAWYAAFAREQIADYCKAGTAANESAALAKNVDVTRINKAREEANPKRARNKQLPKLKFVVAKKVLRMPLVELVALLRALLSTPVE